MNVYFIRTKVKPSMLKIGKANDVERRMAELQTGSPHELLLVGSIRCRSEMHAIGVEQRLHRIFRHAKSRGEWFHFSRQTEAAVKQLLATGLHADLSETARVAFKQHRSERRALRRRMPVSVDDRNAAMDREFREVVGR